LTTGHRPDRSDEFALVREIATGSQAALATLYDRHAGAIYAVVGRLTSDRGMAEEVVQETFLTLWNRAELFDPATGSLAAWLNTIGRNRAIDRLRALGRRPGSIPLSAISVGDEGDSALDRIAAAGALIGGGGHPVGPEAALEATELHDEVGRALEALPEPERRVLELAYRDELTQVEIAEQLGWPLGTVKTRTRRALLRLRGDLAGSLGFPVGSDRAAAELGAAGGDETIIWAK